MNIKEASQILKEKYQKENIRKCFEYKNCFVFLLGDKTEFDSLVAVDKSSKKVHAFMPIMIPADEYNKPIKTYTFE